MKLIKKQRRCIDKKFGDIMFEKHFLMLPGDMVFEIFSFLTPNTIRIIMESDSGILNYRYNTEDFYCKKHGTTMKWNTKKTDVLQRIKNDGLDPSVFMVKLRERTEWFHCGVHGSPFEGKGEVYKKYLLMMSECKNCEQEATDIEMAKSGLERCSKCNEYEKYNKFFLGCDNDECSKNGCSDICIDCADEWHCDFCSHTYCPPCALNDESFWCPQCNTFSCGFNDCHGEGTDNFTVMHCNLCDRFNCTDCEPFMGLCDVCGCCYCDECQDMLHCDSCDNFFCIECRHVGVCDSCESCYCVECSKIFYSDDCEKNTCKNCHDICKMQRIMRDWLETGKVATSQDNTV